MTAAVLVAAGCAPYAAPAAAPAPVAGARTVPPSIAANCSRDVTAQLLGWIASVPDGSTLEFARNGCYRIDGTLKLYDRNNLTFDGNGATFRPYTDGTELGPSGARGRAQFFFIRGSNITLQDLTVRGARNLGLNRVGWDLEAQHAFVVGQTRGFRLDHVQAYDVYGDFVYVGPFTTNVLVEHSVFDTNGRQGWTVNGGTNITFTANTIRNVAHATIDLEPDSTGALDGLTVSNNVVGPTHLFFFNIGGAPVALRNIRITGNHLVDKDMKIQAATPGTLTNLTISGNWVDGPMERTGVDQSGGGAFFIENATNVTVSNNYVSMTCGRHITGVNLSNSHNVTVTGNTWNGGMASISYYWLAPHPSDRVTFSANKVGLPPAPETLPGSLC